MTDGPRLGVFFTPTPFEAAWRAALIAAARAAGWQVIEGASPVAVAPGKGQGALRLATCETAMAVWSAADWLIIADRPSAALAASVAAAGMDIAGGAPLAAIWHTAQRFAAASSLASGGARVVDAPSRTLDLPHLGRVDREDAVAVTPIPTTALDVYRAVPPVSGATALWPADLFTYPAGRVTAAPLQVDLTGRPRALVYGPHIVLPAGDWRATVRIGADPEGGHIRLRLEWGPAADMTTASVTIGEPGHYAIALEQRWRAQGAAEVRLWLEQAAFGGRLGLLDVQVERL